MVVVVEIIMIIHGDVSGKGGKVVIVSVRFSATDHVGSGVVVIW